MHACACPHVHLCKRVMRPSGCEAARAGGFGLILLIKVPLIVPFLRWRFTAVTMATGGELQTFVNVPVGKGSDSFRRHRQAAPALHEPLKQTSTTSTQEPQTTGHLPRPSALSSSAGHVHGCSRTDWTCTCLPSSACIC